MGITHAMELLLVFLLGLVPAILCGQTCSFTQSSTTYSVFCENGCCSNACCKTSTVDTDAVAIGVSVALALLLLILLIILIVYCYKKRKNKKKDWDENSTTTNDNTVVLYNMPTRKTAKVAAIKSDFYETTKYTQTGEPTPPYREKVFFGRSNRWKLKKNQIHRRRLPSNTGEKSTQTPGNQPTMIRPAQPPAPVTPYLEEVVTIPEKSSQTSAQPKNKGAPPGSKLYDPNRVARDKTKQGYSASWAAHPPWQHHTNQRSLDQTQPKPLDTYANFGSADVEPYSTSELGHYRYDSDVIENQGSSRSSMTFVRPRSLNGYD
ncbi:uncharacterized protein LOC131934647 [Physella acuta]|uniref:uncharacterized protein LOC131934647 n=1 Tax=Physella acuta TaxID=109671 RepID=UPI0027DDCB6A|nr:uncharacterized protein LOC131934647 [Physella acuta]XP_059146700.1 uncharacterized protein LOC131934647 [Physella acuta]